MRPAVVHFLSLSNPLPRLLPLFPYGPDGAWTASGWLWSGIALAAAAVLVASVIESADYRRTAGGTAMSDDLPAMVASGYDRVAEEYARLEAGDDWPRMRWLDEVLRWLPDRVRVLDLGCGNGLPVTARLAERHAVTGVDVSARQIELARGNVPDAEFAVADLLDLRYPAESFDAVVAFYTFDHLPRERLGELFGRIRDWLRPGGLLLFSVEPEDQPGTLGQWLGVPMFFSSYDADTTRRLVREAGFEVVRDAVERQREGSTDVDYLWIMARKAAQAKK